nr:MAG TPA: hypothetical protein [Caudoviricetes sp.]
MRLTAFLGELSGDTANVAASCRIWKSVSSNLDIFHSVNGCLWKFNHSTDDRPERRPKKAPRLGAG